MAGGPDYSGGGLDGGGGRGFSRQGHEGDHDGQRRLAQVRAALGDWHVWVGIALMLGYVLLYVYSLGMAELSLVLPLSAASYLLGALLAKHYLGEEIKPARWIGTFIITAGVCVIAYSGFADASSDEKDKPEASAPSGGADAPAPAS